MSQEKEGNIVPRLMETIGITSSLDGKYETKRM